MQKDRETYGIYMMDSRQMFGQEVHGSLRRCWVQLICVLLLTSVTRLAGEKVLGEETQDFDFDGLPGAMHDFRIDIAGGREECYYQNAVAGATLVVEIRVLRGGDRNVDVVITAPDGHIVDKHLWKSEGTTEHTALVDGIYQICIDNTFSRFTSKLVYLYLVTFVADDWERYSKEVQEITSTVQNFSSALGSVQESISDMIRYQAGARMEIIRDWYLITANLKYVTYWSVVQCIVVVCSAAAQVYFLRRLFDVKNVTPTAKPRA